MTAAARNVASSPDRDLPADVVERAKMHVLDGIASAVSGARLGAGQSARRWLGSLVDDGGGSSTILGAGTKASCFVAALCNGVAAHADETDDSHGPSGSHPGSSIIPASLALGEHLHATGQAFLRAVVTGYDLGGRVGRAIRPSPRNDVENRPTSHSVVGAFGSAAAVASLQHFDERRVRFLLAYTGQQCSGVRTYLKAPDHLEKAFAYGGMPASQAILSAGLVAAGWTASEDSFGGSLSWLETAYPGHDRAQIGAAWSERFEVMETTIKKHSVGSPAARGIEAALQIMKNPSFVVEDISGITVQMGARGAFVVGERSMPNVNVRYLLAVTLLDGALSFEAAHDETRLGDPRVRDLMGRTSIVPEEARDRSGAVTLTIECGDSGGTMRFEETVDTIRGIPSNPMSWDEVREKAEDLMGPVLGASASTRVVTLVSTLESVGDIGELAATAAGLP